MAGQIARNEREASFNGNPDAELAALREQLCELQLPQIAHGRRAIILIEGPQGAGKKHVLRQITAALDPCHSAVHCTRYERREASDGHWLARFWRQLPPAGETSIFLRSWYRRVLDDRLLGRIDEKTAARSFDEINEFEAQQRDYGTLLVKLYFDVSPEVQEQRLKARASNPWLPLIERDPVIEVRRQEYQDAVQLLRENSDTRWSPWRIVNADDEQKAAISALRTVTQAWSEAMPAEPPQAVGASRAA